MVRATETQRIAIKGFLQTLGEDWYSLISGALRRTSNLPELEDLSYKQAVEVIKYGNSITPKV